MTELRMFQVDAFAERVFAGNPAAVLVLDAWLDGAVMQAIAAENNLAETAFARRDGAGFELRWFTPLQEVAFCGHATLATAHVLATAYDATGEIVFSTRRVGQLMVRRGEDGYTLDLPCLPPQPIASPDERLGALFPAGWDAVFRNFENVFVVLADEAAVRSYVPDAAGIAALSGMGLCITAPVAQGGGFDFVSRYFAPAAGIAEDPVTGSTHATLVPYWAGRLGRSDLVAYQASWRGGRLGGRLAGERVLLTGRAVTFMDARIYLPD